MPSLDLRKLSAPLAALGPEVDAAYKRLDDQWDAITKQLRKLPIPCTISHKISHDGSGHEWISLEFRKWKGAKRLCVTYHSEGNGPNGWDESEEVTPFEEWSGEQRVDMLRHVPGLFKSAVKQVQHFIDRTKDVEENQ